MISDSEYEIVLAEDLAIYLARLGRPHPLDRYARAAGFAPGSDKAIVLEAMRQARFSLWHIERHHETTGLILRDLLRDEEIWLIDEALAKNVRPGQEMAARLTIPDRFAMTARVIVPIIPALMTRSELMEEVSIQSPCFEKPPRKGPCWGPPSVPSASIAPPWPREQWTSSASSGNRLTFRLKTYSSSPQKRQSPVESVLEEASSVTSPHPRPYGRPPGARSLRRPCLTTTDSSALTAKGSALGVSSRRDPPGPCRLQRACLIKTKCSIR